jgi:hypothetical protein
MAQAQLALLADDEDCARFKRAMVHEMAMVSWEPIALAGRAARELRHLTVLEALPSPPSPCPVAGVQTTVSSSSRLYPCCSAWSNHSAHALGTIGPDGDFASVRQRMRDDAVVKFIHELGPGELIRFLREKGASMPDRYADPCHMCDTLFSQLSASEVRATVEAYHSERPWVQVVQEVQYMTSSFNPITTRNVAADRLIAGLRGGTPEKPCAGLAPADGDANG